MRERLTLALLGLSLVVMAVLGTVRAHALADVVRDNEAESLAGHTALLARALDVKHQEGEEVDYRDVWPLAGPEVQLTVEHPDYDTIVAQGSRWGLGGDVEPITTTQSFGSTTVTAVESGERVELLVSEALGPLLALLLVMLVLVGAAAFVIGWRLARPIVALAESANALSRGRFDLELAESRVPEVVAVSAALRSAADRVRLSLHGQDRGLQDTSHSLRTPLTGLRLELEQVLCDPVLDEEVRSSLERGLDDVTRLEGTVEEVLERQRSRSLVPDAEVSLVELGQHAATRWRDRLPASREVKTFVDGGEDLAVTPGPVEQVLDRILTDVRECGTGSVTLRFEAEESHLRVRVRGGPERSSHGERTAVDAAREMTETLGGRWQGDPLHGGLEVLLPRR